MLNKYLLIGGCLLTLANYAQAADSVDLKVTGKLLSGSCTPTLENGGVVDFGHIPLGNLSKTEVNRIGQKHTVFTITCSSSIPVGWTTVDNRHDSLINIPIKNAYWNGGDNNTGGNQYGLGKTTADTRLGAFVIGVQVDNVSVDGVKGDLITWSFGAGQSSASGSDWVKTSVGATLNGADGNFRGLTIAASGTLTPLAGKVFIYPMLITAAIQGTDTLAITDNTNLDGSATISLVYL
ncbi:TPA: DUF1120 domain-containing protein [Citrobacter farmeri]|nr:DUF1120 domain-containing protein [Citrobacter farmeri]